MTAVRPSVSVVVPAYRAAGTLGRAIEGVLAQSEPVAEIVLVLDGAVDETPEIAAELAARHPQISIVTLIDNVGVARARQAGVWAATSEFVLFADADDRMPPTGVEALVDVVVAYGADVAVGGAEALRADGTMDFVLRGPARFDVVPRTHAFRCLLRGEVTGHLWNKLIRRSVLEACMPFAVSEVHSDLALTARVLSEASVVGFTREVVYRYQANPGSLLTTRRRRAESLDVVENAVTAAAAHIDPVLLTTADFDYFLTRYVLLSRVKDGLAGEYRRGQGLALARAARRNLGWRRLRLVLHRRDFRRAAMILSSRVSLSLHARLVAPSEPGDPAPRLRSRPILPARFATQAGTGAEQVSG